MQNSFKVNEAVYLSVSVKKVSPVFKTSNVKNAKRH